MESNNQIKIELNDKLSEQELDEIANKYRVSPESKHKISKRDGAIYFEEIPIEHWDELLSAKDTDDLYRH